MRALCRAVMRRALRFYPAVWRARYQEEMLQVIEAFPVTPWTVADFLLGALDARLHPDLVPGRIITMIQRVRTSLITIFCAIVLFSLAWAGLYQVKDPLPSWEAATLRYPAIASAFEIEQGMGVIVFLALLIGGAPLLFTALCDAFRHRMKVLALFLIPILAIAGIGAFAIFALGASMTKVTPGDPNSPLAPLAVILQFVLLLLLTILSAGGTAAIALVVARTSVDARFLRFALLLAAIATAAMAAGLVAAVALTALSYQDAPQLAPGEIAFCAILMLVAVALAIAALRRGLRAARVAGDATASAAQP